MTKSNVIHIACALNDYYVMPYGVMLVSLLENNKKHKIHIHVFSGQLNNTSIKSLENIARKYHAGFTFYPLDDKEFQNLAISDRISRVTYYRDVIPGKISPEIEKILYLDGDMIVLGDISELWNTNIDNYIVATVDDLYAIHCREFDRLKIPEKYGYFNSGLFLINRNEWVKNNISQKIFDYTRENIANLKFLDQDVENYVMHTQRKVIDQKWNQQVGLYFMRSGFNNPDYSEKTLEEVKSKPVIVHFNGVEKPWNYVNLHPFKKEFNRYLKISGFKKLDEQVTLRKIAKKVVYRTMGWSWWNRIKKNV